MKIYVCGLLASVTLMSASCKKDKIEPEQPCTSITNNTLGLEDPGAKDILHGHWYRVTEYNTGCYEDVATTNYLPSELRLDFYWGLDTPGSGFEYCGAQYNPGESGFNGATFNSTMVVRRVALGSIADGDGIKFDDPAVAGIALTVLEYCKHWEQNGVKYITFKDVTPDNIYGTPDRHYITYKRLN